MKQALPFLYFILFSCVTLFAQEENFQIPDSLANKSNEELINSIREYRYNNPKIAKIYAEAFHIKATAEQHTNNIIDSYFYLSHIYDIQGEYTKSIELINKGIEKAEADNNKLLWKVYNLRGKVKEEYGKEEEAAKDFNASLIAAQRHNSKRGAIIAKTGIALIQLNTKQYHESLKTYKNMLRVSKDTLLVSKYSRNSILIGICENHLRREELDSALVYLNQGLKESFEANDLESASYFYPFKALYYYHKDDIPKSLEVLEKARKEISDLQTDDKRNIEVYYYMAQCHVALKDYQSAIRAIERGFHLIDKENLNNAENTIAVVGKDQFVPYEYLYLLETLVQCYEELGDEKNRDYYFEKYYPLKLESHQKDVRINKLLFNFDEAPRIALIEKLSKKEGTAEKKVKYLYYVLAIVFVGLIIGFIFYRRKEQQKQIAYKALIEKVSELERKNTTVKAPKNTTTKKTVTITDEKAQAILKGLEKFEAQEQYLDENCNLRFVAKKVKTNATYLSKIVNTHKETSFNDYINDLRIQYTLKRLKSDSLFRAYSIKSIAQEVGYKSADSFTKHFKKQTSLYPSYYIKNLNKENA